MIFCRKVSNRCSHSTVSIGKTTYFQVELWNYHSTGISSISRRELQRWHLESFISLNGQEFWKPEVLKTDCMYWKQAFLNSTVEKRKDGKRMIKFGTSITKIFWTDLDGNRKIRHLFQLSNSWDCSCNFVAGGLFWFLKAFTKICFNPNNPGKSQKKPRNL